MNICRLAITCILLTFSCGRGVSGPAVSDSLRARGEIRDVVRGFFLWYCANYESVSAIHLLAPAAENDKQYRLDRRGEEEYIAKVMASGFFAPDFPAKIRKYLAACEKLMLKSRQEEGPPEGLDLDLFFCGQEYSPTPEFVQTCEFTDLHITGNGASVRMLTTANGFCDIRLGRVRGVWKIAAICEFR